MRPPFRAFLFFTFHAWLATSVTGVLAGEPAADSLVTTINDRLSTLPPPDFADVTGPLQKLFAGADQARLMRLAEHPNWNIAMWARWEMRRKLDWPAFDPENRYYPVRFLETQGIEVPVAWAKKFSAQFLPSKALRQQAAERYRKQPKSKSRMVFADSDPRTYVRCTECDIPAGTTVEESETHLVIKQAGLSARLEKPLTRNYNNIFGGYGGNLLLPLVSQDVVYVLFVRGSQMHPYELSCHETRTGAERWDTVGWSAWPQVVKICPRNLATPSFDQWASRATIVGPVKPIGRDGAGEGRGGGQSGPTQSACSFYITANDKFVTVFAEERIMSVEVFDVRTGRNVLRFATDFYGAEAAAAEARRATSPAQPK